ncbi:MAG: LysR family transcriptional regulator [Pseudomonadota bacterium]
MLGPGKADLLERIGETGSIAAAGRSMGMSYKRAWMLVETLNEIFADPLVTSTRGGTAGGGAVLTDTGKRVLTCYREIESQARRSTAHEIDTLSSLLKYPPGPATPDDTA